jgi:hypothetical protein
LVENICSINALLRQVHVRLKINVHVSREFYTLHIFLFKEFVTTGSQKMAQKFQ